MQLCNLEVRLNSSPIHTVNKFDVTPAEIQILHAIHGPSSLVNIKPTKMDKRPQSEEWKRLSTAYGRNPEGLADAGNGDLLDKLFPGVNKRLPVTLKEIGLGHLLNPSHDPEAPAPEHEDEKEDD